MEVVVMVVVMADGGDGCGWLLKWWMSVLLF